MNNLKDIINMPINEDELYSFIIDNYKKPRPGDIYFSPKNDIFSLLIFIANNHPIDSMSISELNKETLFENLSQSYLRLYKLTCTELINSIKKYINQEHLIKTSSINNLLNKKIKEIEETLKNQILKKENDCFALWVVFQDLSKFYDDLINQRDIVISTLIKIENIFTNKTKLPEEFEIIEHLTKNQLTTKEEILKIIKEKFWKSGPIIYYLKINQKFLF